MIVIPMTDEFEESRIFLELYYFTVSTITENMNPLQYFKSDFVLFMQPIVSKFVQQFQGQSDRKIVTSQAYKQFTQNYITKIKKIIDAIKQSGLWIPQGGAPTTIDATELIGQVLNCDNPDIEQLLLLRCVKINQLLYSPELTLYYNACLLCCQSSIIVVRLYAYSLLRLAPTIVDLRHLFNVFKFIMNIWDSSPVSFEFCAAFYLLLTRLSDHRPSPVDENEFNLILQMIERLHSSGNFETLMCFDSSLKWMYKLFPQEMLLNIFPTTLESLKSGHCGDFCILVHCLSHGIGDASIMPEAVANAIKTAPNWPKSIQRETRNELSAFITKDDSILDIISVVLNQPAMSDVTLYLFAGFLINHYLGTSAPLHLELTKALLTIENSRSKEDAESILTAICSNPCRLLDLILTIPESLPKLLSLPDPKTVTIPSLLEAIRNNCILPESTATQLCDKFSNYNLNADECDGSFPIQWLQVDLPIAVSIHPQRFVTIFERIPSLYDEGTKKFLLELFAIVALQGKISESVEAVAEALRPFPTYSCEYSELLELIDSAQPLKAGVMDASSRECVAAALLVEHIAWSEGGEPLVVLKRLRVRPALWAAAALSSGLASAVTDSEQLVSICKTPAALACAGYAVLERSTPGLKEALVYERFGDLPRLLLYPRVVIDTTEAANRVSALEQKYAQTFELILKLIPGN